MIEQDILRDILLEEERVPSTNELARLYAINPATAARESIFWWRKGFCTRNGESECCRRGGKGSDYEKKKRVLFDDYIRGLLLEAASLGISKKELIEMIAGAGEQDEEASGNA